jgi:hypothetical protein
MSSTTGGHGCSSALLSGASATISGAREEAAGLKTAVVA